MAEEPQGQKESNPPQETSAFDLRGVIDRVKESIKQPETSQIERLSDEDVLDRQVDRRLRQRWANYFVCILTTQLLVMNVVFILVGVNWLQYQQKWVLELYLAGTLTEVFGIVLVITKNLFPEKK